MGNPYPAEVTDENGSVRLAGQVDFTDPANQPASAQPFSVVGPFHITHATPNLSSGVALAAFTIGTIVLRAWATLGASAVSWDVGFLSVGLGKNDGSGGASAIIYDLAQSGGAPFELSAYFGQLTDPAAPPVTFFQDYPLVGVVKTDYTSLVVSATDSPSTGEADVYAMIYTP